MQSLIALSCYQDAENIVFVQTRKICFQDKQTFQTFVQHINLALVKRYFLFDLLVLFTIVLSTFSFK